MFGAPCPDIVVTCTLCFYNVPFGIMSHDRCGYLMQSLGKEVYHLNGRSLGMDYVIWSLGRRAILGQFGVSTGHCLSHITGMEWAWMMP